MGDLYDWRGLEQLYALCEICALYEISRVQYMTIFSKWWDWCNLLIVINEEWC